MNITVRNSPQAGSATDVLKMLCDAFDTAFDGWRRDADEWQRISHTTTIDDADVPLLGDPPVSMAETPTGGLLQVSFTDDHGVDWLAVSDVDMAAAKWAPSLANAILREAQRTQENQRLRQQVEACNVQISNDFEEICFLREVAEHLDIAGVLAPFTQFAEGVLPLLRRSVRAESAVLVALDPDGSQKSLCVGSVVVSDETCGTLIETFGRPDMKSVVLNHLGSRDDGDQFAGIESLVLVRVANDDDLFGWLMAINRREEVSVSTNKGDDEFGTVEGGIISTTASILATHAQNIKLYLEKENVLVSLVRSLVNAIEAKDPYTCGHSERVAIFARHLADAAGLSASDCDRVYLSGLLHDVGKIGISDAALSKPGKLSPEEFAEIRRHPDLGWQILQESDHLKDIFPGVVHHHERMDGQGYPDGLAGHDIPLDARILAVADAYDAMTSDRPYRQGLPQEKAEAILREEAGTQWDASLVQVFLSIMPNIIRLRQDYRREQKPKRQ